MHLAVGKLDLSHLLLESKFMWGEIVALPLLLLLGQKGVFLEPLNKGAAWFNKAS